MSIEDMDPNQLGYEPGSVEFERPKPPSPRPVPPQEAPKQQEPEKREPEKKSA